jgi:hypothetical protein
MRYGLQWLLPGVLSHWERLRGADLALPQLQPG